MTDVGSYLFVVWRQQSKCSLRLHTKIDMLPLAGVPGSQCSGKYGDGPCG